MHPAKNPGRHAAIPSVRLSPEELRQLVAQAEALLQNETLLLPLLPFKRRSVPGLIPIAALLVAGLLTCWPATMPPHVCRRRHAGDVQAAKAIGLDLIAVATGIYSLEQLAEEKPDWCLASLRGLHKS